MTAYEKIRILLTSAPGVVTDETFARFGIGYRTAVSHVDRLRRRQGMRIQRVKGLGWRLQNHTRRETV